MTSNALRLALVSAILVLPTSARIATAQTVIVRNVAARSTVELVLNDTASGSATADASGTARLSGSLIAVAHKTETDAHVIVDSCGDTTRVLVVEAVHAPPAMEGACRRQTVPDTFVMRSTTSLVVDVSGATPSVSIRQGRPPASWLAGESERSSEKKTYPPAPIGFVLAASWGFSRFSNAASVACGDVTGCNGPGANSVPTVAAAFWLAPFLAGEVAYLAPSDLHTTGSGTNFNFSNTVQTSVLMIVAKAGGQAGPVRLYGFGGPTYQEAVSTTTQTVTNPVGIGGTAFKATGWGWVAGGGIERWFTSWIGISAEGARFVLKGSPPPNQNGTLDDTMWTATFGVRIHVGR